MAIVFGIILICSQDIICFYLRFKKYPHQNTDSNNSDTSKQKIDDYSYDLELYSDKHPLGYIFHHQDLDYSYKYTFSNDQCDNLKQKICQKTIDGTVLCGPIDKQCHPSDQLTKQRSEFERDFVVYVNNTIYESDQFQQYQHKKCDEIDKKNIYRVCKINYFFNQTLIDMHNKFVDKFEDMNRLADIDFFYFLILLSGWASALLFRFFVPKESEREKIYVNAFSGFNPILLTLCNIELIKYPLFHYMLKIYYLLVNLVIVFFFGFMIYLNCLIYLQIYNEQLSYEDKDFINSYKNEILLHSQIGTEFTKDRQNFINLADQTLDNLIKTVPNSEEPLSKVVYAIRCSTLFLQSVIMVIQAFRMTYVYLICACYLCRSFLLPIIYKFDGIHYTPYTIRGKPQYNRVI